jgi:hypothetical protein
MALPEANSEMVVMARTLPKDCIAFSIPGGLARDDTAIAILLSKRQQTKIIEVYRQGPAVTPSLRRAAADAGNTHRAKPGLCYISKHNGKAPEEAASWPWET